MRIVALVSSCLTEFFLSNFISLRADNNSMAVTLGFEQKNTGGNSWIYLDSDRDKRKAQLKEIADNIGWSDEALNN